MGEIRTKTNTELSEVRSQKLEAREYQIKIANECTNRNSLVVLPTGLGKTIIAVLVARKILGRVPEDSKIIILAPTRPLIDQHRSTFLKFLDIPEENLALLTGKIAPEKRVDVFTNTQLLFFTPQTLRNDLVSRRYTLKNTALIIFDEAHHASGDYPYTMIADELTDQNPDAIILALTASPGASKSKIVELCENLHIPLENIHIRTRKDAQVKKYVKPMDIYKIGVNLNTIMSEIYKVVNLILEERLQYLSRHNLIDKSGDNLHIKVIRKDLLRLNSELVRIVNGTGDKTGIYSALSINAQGLILFHMLELIEQQGLDVLLDYLEKLNKNAKKKNSSKASRILAADNRIRRIYLELKKAQQFSPDNLIHPKYHVLVKVLLDELHKNSDSRILVFVKLRNSVKNIVNKLKDINTIKPARFVGQATKSQDDKGLSQKRQIELLKEFKQGIYNVLVSTNVGEEGLDIAECDMVIFYDVVASEIRLIQRKGRTARHREGKVVILYCKDTHDEIYLRIALSKLKRMNTTLKNPRQLQEASFESDTVSPTGESFKDEALNSKENTTSQKQHQTRLQQFFGSKEIVEDMYSVKISRLVPLKFGLRKVLKAERIPYTITDSDLHIIIYNKVLIQILDPEEIDFSTLLSEIQELKQICSLLIVIFDFIESPKSDESRKLKHRIQELGKLHRLQFIPIDNEEELLFMLKSILESVRWDE